MESPEDVERRSEELERQAEQAGIQSEKLAREIEDTKSDWESKKADSGIPGAADPDRAGPVPEGSEDEDEEPGSYREPDAGEAEDAAESDWSVQSEIRKPEKDGE